MWTFAAACVAIKSGGPQPAGCGETPPIRSGLSQTFDAVRIYGRHGLLGSLTPYRRRVNLGEGWCTRSIYARAVPVATVSVGVSVGCAICNAIEHGTY
jgi:hypothetical protein